MPEAAIDSWSHQDESLLSLPQKKRKSQSTRPKKSEKFEVILWFCCYCNHGGMTHQVPGCANCNIARCNLCRWEKFEVGWEERKLASCTWREDDDLREEAALLDMTTAEPLQAPDLMNAATGIACTTLELDPTCDQLGVRKGQLIVPIPEHVTPQSLIEHTLHSLGDTQFSPTVRAQVGFELSSLSLHQVDTIAIPTEPSTLNCSFLKQVADWESSLPHDTDTIGKIIVAFDRWRTHGSNTSNDSSSTTNAGPSSSNEPNRSTAPKQSGKRASNRGNPSKQSRAKKPKVSTDEVPQARKDDKRLLACPFWKKDSIGHRDCFRGVKDISDVKQHLQRSHQQPVFCPRCGMEFGVERAALSEHLRATEQCETRNFQHPEGITIEHEEALERYSDRSADEATQWYVIWDYLFPGGPNVETPPPPRPRSPYVDQDLSEDMSSFREFSHLEGWRALVNDPELSHVALDVDEELLQRCLDRIHESWRARRSTGSQQSRGEIPLTLSDSSAPDARALISEAASIDHQPGDDDMMALNDFTADLDSEHDSVGFQIDAVFDNSVTMPTVDDNTAETLPSVPLLASDHEIEDAMDVPTQDPTLINR